jgi:predicted RNase H-like nuclease
MRHVGIDLAWSDHNPTGVCALDDRGRVVDERVLDGDEEIVDWLGMLPDGPAVVAVDAPLRVPNETGRRTAEAEVQAAYGRRKAGAHPSNRSLFLDRYGRVRGEDLALRLASLGFEDPWLGGERVLLEVYPHPALIEAFGLEERLLYKAKPGVGPAGRRTGLRNLARLIDALALADPPLIGPTVEVPEDARGRELKRIEDSLDARICAWIAAVWTRHGRERVQLHGSSAGGHIAVPTGRFVAADVHLDPVERRSGDPLG